jgi:large subunit ribosomal protein L21
MNAVIFTGGKQYLVEEGQTIKVEKLDAEVGSEVVFDKILMTAKEDGQDVQIGTPFLDGKTVTALVKAQGREKKVRVVKYKPKIRYKRTIGHRQSMTTVTIGKIA